MRLTWLERTYLWYVLKGLVLTSRHFARNLALHTLHLVGIARKVPAAVTIQYPEEKRPLSVRARSLHRLTKRDDGTPRCVACLMCETVCPAHCIYIVETEHPDPRIEKMPARFDIDMGVCVFCGYCVDVCPEDAIRMDTGRFDIAAYAREEMVFTMEMLLANEQGLPEEPLEDTGEPHPPGAVAR